MCFTVATSAATEPAWLSTEVCEVRRDGGVRESVGGSGQLRGQAETPAPSCRGWHCPSKLPGGGSCGRRWQSSRVVGEVNRDGGPRGSADVDRQVVPEPAMRQPFLARCALGCLCQLREVASTAPRAADGSRQLAWRGRGVLFAGRWTRVGMRVKAWGCECTMRSYLAISSSKLNLSKRVLLQCQAQRSNQQKR